MVNLERFQREKKQASADAVACLENDGSRRLD